MGEGDKQALSVAHIFKVTETSRVGLEHAAHARSQLIVARVEHLQPREGGEPGAQTTQRIV